MTTPQPIGTRKFAYADQMRFAALSGDFNPIHVDALDARRSVVGELTVHGAHALSWALDCLARHRPQLPGLVSVDVAFARAIHLDQEICAELSRETPGQLTITLRDERQRSMATMRIEPGELPVIGGPDGPSRDTAAPAAARDRVFESLAGLSGKTDWIADRSEFSKAFPAAAARFGTGVLGDIASSSQLVGMDCPGLRSVFAKLKLEWTARAPADPLKWRVRELDDRFRLIRMELCGGTVRGLVQAYAPAARPLQPTTADINKLVAPGRFAGQRALVIGGSRGLGELAAKIVAASGAHVTITHAVGKDDAEAVVDDIRVAGGQAATIAYNVLAPSGAQLAALGPDNVPDTVYYFATGRITPNSIDGLDHALLARHMQFYVEGFAHLCQGLYGLGARKVACFYPSTVYVEDRPRGMTEYAMAKAAGEVLAHDIGRLVPGFRGHVERLPRLLTDQTAGVVHETLPSAIEVLLPAISRFGDGQV